MLITRILTAVVLLAVLLPALFVAAPPVFNALAMVFIAAAAWEWARLAGLAPAPSLFLGAGCVAACVASWQAGWQEGLPRGFWLVAAAGWTLGGAWLLRTGVAGWQALPRSLRLAVGLLLLWLAWLAVAGARVVGVNFLLSAMALVWVADVGAYFAGKTFGGRWFPRKLAPGISPGKTWEGALGGLLGVLLLAALWRWADAHWMAEDASLYTRLLGAQPLWGWLALVWLSVMSVVGDLVESLVKRAAGAKDSSRLLPGHGGVLDRIDALLPTLPLAMLLAGV